MSDTGYPKAGERIAPDGSVTNVFPGGLEVPVAAPSPAFEPSETVRWVTASGGALLAQISGGWVAAGPGIGSTFLGLAAQDAEIRLTGAAAQAEVKAIADGETATVLRGDGGSSFLRVTNGGLGGLPNLVMRVGQADALFAGSAPNEGTTTGVLHGLGREPLFAIAAPTYDGDLFWSATAQGVVDRDASTVTFGFQLNNGEQASGTLSFAWLAIG